MQQTEEKYVDFFSCKATCQSSRDFTSFSSVKFLKNLLKKEFVKTLSANYQVKFAY